MLTHLAHQEYVYVGPLQHSHEIVNRGGCFNCNEDVFIFINYDTGGTWD